MKAFLVIILLVVLGSLAFFSFSGSGVATEARARAVSVSVTEIYMTVSAEQANRSEMTAVVQKATELANEAMLLMSTHNATVLQATTNAEVATRQITDLTVAAAQAQATTDTQLAVWEATRLAEEIKLEATRQAQEAQLLAEQARLSADATVQMQAYQMGQTATAQANWISATATASWQQERAYQNQLRQYQEQQSIRRFAQILLVITLPIALIALVVGGFWFVRRYLYLREQEQLANQPVREIIIDNRRVIVLNSPNGPQVYDPITGTHHDALLGEGENKAHAQDALIALAGEDCVLVYGGRGTGKTSLLKHLVAARQRAGTDVRIIDPHFGANDSWAGYGYGTVVGTALDYDGLETELKAIVGEMVLRFQQRGAHRPMLVVIDEWRDFVREKPAVADLMLKLVTKARKVGIDVMLISHSRNVKALGIQGEGDLRENFTIVHTQRESGRRWLEVEREGGNVTYPHPGPWTEQLQWTSARMRPAERNEPPPPPPPYRGTGQASTPVSAEPTADEVMKMSWETYKHRVKTCFAQNEWPYLVDAIASVYNAPRSQGGGGRGADVKRALKELYQAGQISSLPHWMTVVGESRPNSHDIVQGEIIA